MSTPTKQADPYRTTYHRDGTVTVWDVHQQCWYRREARDVYADDALMSSLNQAERARIARMASRN